MKFMHHENDRTFCRHKKISQETDGIGNGESGHKHLSFLHVTAQKASEDGKIEIGDESAVRYAEQFDNGRRSKF